MLGMSFKAEQKPTVTTVGRAQKTNQANPMIVLGA